MKNHTIIIAEAGVNHNGNISIAKKLIDAAAAAGVDYVKFQTFKAEKLVTKDAKKAIYQQQNMKGEGDSQFDMLKRLELSKEDHLELIAYCNKQNVQFLSTAFDLDSIDLLYDLGIRLFKIPSGEITNLPYLRKIATLAKDVIISTGMASVEDIEGALKVFTDSGIKKENITILHCNTEYPTPMADVNLNAMLSIKTIFNIKIGYSDHTRGIEIPIAAVALGASVIEKHFTLDRTMEGPDHEVSLEPIELIEMTKAIRNIEIALGDGVKKPSESEKVNIIPGRKSIYLSVSLPKGSVIRGADLEMLRPGDGISPMKMDDVIGKELTKNLTAGHKLTFEDFN